MNIKCWLGHQWSKWEILAKKNGPAVYFIVAKRQCARCGKPEIIKKEALECGIG